MYLLKSTMTNMLLGSSFAHTHFFKCVQMMAKCQEIERFEGGGTSDERVLLSLCTQSVQHSVTVHSEIKYYNYYIQCLFIFLQ